YGTGCFVLLNTGATPVASRHGLLTTIAWQIDGKTTYALEGSVFIAGAAMQWLRDGLGLLENAGDSQAMAESVPDTGGVYFVPALPGSASGCGDRWATSPSARRSSGRSRRRWMLASAKHDMKAGAARLSEPEVGPPDRVRVGKFARAGCPHMRR